MLTLKRDTANFTYIAEVDRSLKVCNDALHLIYVTIDLIFGLLFKFLEYMPADTVPTVHVTRLK